MDEAEVVELFRSRETLARKERETKGDEAPALIAEERLRQRRHHDELRRRKAACLSGSAYFRGNDRSPAKEFFPLHIRLSRRRSSELGQIGREGQSANDDKVPRDGRRDHGPHRF
jgi:hypothetical protein